METLYRKVLCSERLPDKESNYFAILKSGEYSFYRFNPGESIDKLWFQKSVDVWLEQLPEQKVGEQQPEVSVKCTNYEEDDSTAMNCKWCGDPKWVHDKAMLQHHSQPEGEVLQYDKDLDPEKWLEHRNQKPKQQPEVSDGGIEKAFCEYESIDKVPVEVTFESMEAHQLSDFQVWKAACKWLQSPHPQPISDERIEREAEKPFGDGQNLSIVWRAGFIFGAKWMQKQ